MTHLANTLTTYMKNQKLPYVRMPGGGKRIDEADLKAFIENRKSGGSIAHHE